jgi:hypothetical protein
MEKPSSLSTPGTGFQEELGFPLEKPLFQPDKVGLGIHKPTHRGRHETQLLLTPPASRF